MNLIGTHRLLNQPIRVSGRGDMAIRLYSTLALLRTVLWDEILSIHLHPPALSRDTGLGRTKRVTPCMSDCNRSVPATQRLSREPHGAALPQRAQPPHARPISKPGPTLRIETTRRPATPAGIRRRGPAAPRDHWAPQRAQTPANPRKTTPSGFGAGRATEGGSAPRGARARGAPSGPPSV